MAVGRLRLVRHELDAVRMAERGALHEPGDAAGSDEICNTLERIRLLAGRDGDVEGAGDLAHRLHVVMLHRLLEPPVTQLLENAPSDSQGEPRRVLSHSNGWTTGVHQEVLAFFTNWL